MLDSITRPARAVVAAAEVEAHARGHRQVATAHLLLALLEAPPGAVLEARGVTRAAVERELAALLAHDPRAADDDAEALAALGIDLARVREAVEASFGPGALDRVRDETPPSPGLLARITRGRLGSTARADELALLRAARDEAGQPGVSPAARRALELALREAARLGAARVDADHVALGLLLCGDGAAAAVLERLGVDVVATRAELAGRARRTA